jgi:hypothetical protein
MLFESLIATQQPITPQEHDLVSQEVDHQRIN